MAGYSGFSKSNNAIAAEEQEGKFPATTLARMLGVSVQAIKELLQPSAWHHTSKMYNKTDYYSMEDAEEIIDQLKAFKVEKPAEVSYRADVRWLTWGGTKSHPKAIEHKAEDIEVVEKGSFYLFKLPDGDLRKKIGSNGTEVVRK